MDTKEKRFTEGLHVEKWLKKKTLHMLIINVSTDLLRESNEGCNYHTSKVASTVHLARLA